MVGREDKRTNNRTMLPALKKTMQLQVIREQWKYCLPRSRSLSRHATLWGGALRDEPKNGCEGVRETSENRAFERCRSTGIRVCLSTTSGWNLKHWICYSSASLALKNPMIVITCEISPWRKHICIPDNLCAYVRRFPKQIKWKR